MGQLRENAGAGDCHGEDEDDDEAEEMEAALKMKAKLAANSPAAKKPPAKAAVEACIAGHC
jgi:hypothetical protein